MSRRGRSGPTISLFSFQDIITSVMAIVTVITLLLALDLVQRKESRGDDASAALAVELTARLNHAETELSQLQRIADQTDDLVRDVADASPAQLKDEIAKRDATVIELERQKARLEQQDKLWQGQKKSKLVEQFDLDPSRKEREKLEKTIAALDQQRRAEQTENRPVFAMPRGMQKEGWLVLIESDRISLAPLGRPAKPVVLTATGLPVVGPTAVQNFENWLDKQQLASSYFFVLLRPNASESFGEVCKMLDTKKISYGFDLVGSEQNIMHPERGAAL